METYRQLFTARLSGIYVFSISLHIHILLKLSPSNRYKFAAALPKANSTLNTGLLLYIGKTNSTITKKQPMVQISMSSRSRAPNPTSVSTSSLVNLSETDTVEVWLHRNYD